MKVAPLITILGPTASGKTRLAAALAAQINGEIISADSRQVYRDMNIGTGKDYADYIVDNQPIKYHLIDIIAAGEGYNIAKFQQDFQRVYQEIIHREKVPILCGGSGMYLDAILRNYAFTQVPVNQALRDDLEQKTLEKLLIIFKNSPSKYTNLADTSTKKRLIRAIEIASQLTLTGKENNFQKASYSSLNSTCYGIHLGTELRRERISKRLYQRLEDGLIEEVENLLAKGIPPEKLIFYGLEYKFITLYLMAELTYNQALTQLEIAIHQFAKRQMTYFRGMERKGLKIHWLDGTKPTTSLVEEIIKKEHQNENFFGSTNS